MNYVSDSFAISGQFQNIFGIAGIDLIQILAYILSILGLASMISASLVKGSKMKLILFLVFCGNVLVATSYLLEGKGMNGAASCYLGGIMAITNYFFDSKNKPIPMWLSLIYAAAIIGLNLYVDYISNGTITYLGIMVIIASLTFILCINQKNGAKYRFWTLVNMSLWCLYDILVPAYAVLVTHIPQLVFAIVGMIIHDRKKQ